MNLILKQFLYTYIELPLFLHMLCYIYLHTPILFEQFQKALSHVFQAYSSLPLNHSSFNIIKHRIKTIKTAITYEFIRKLEAQKMF